MDRTAIDYLDLLLTDVKSRYPSVRHVPRPSTRRFGEDRYDFAPDNSVFVQAPVTRTGRPRRWGAKWRHKRYGKPGWTYRMYRWQVVQDIDQMAEAAGHQPA